MYKLIKLIPFVNAACFMHICSLKDSSLNSDFMILAG